MRKDFVKKGTMRTVLVLLLLVAGLCCAGAVAAAGQNGPRTGAADSARKISKKSLTEKQKSIIVMSIFTTNGDLVRLKKALIRGLDAGLTVSEISEVLIQLYAYTGFPRSLNAIHCFMSLLNERRAAGMTDVQGREPTPMPDDLDRDAYGARTRATLSGRDTVPPPSGYQLFAPAIDSFLKEHLFADIFYRDNLDWQSRELATISALSAMSGTAGQLRFHLNAAMNMGLTEAQMRAFVDVVAGELGRDWARQTEEVLDNILAAGANKS